MITAYQALQETITNLETQTGRKWHISIAALNHKPLDAEIIGRVDFPGLCASWEYRFRFAAYLTQAVSIDGIFKQFQKEAIERYLERPKLFLSLESWIEEAQNEHG